jgi:hypothetical protein
LEGKVLMTLDNMATFICNKVGRPDSASISSCKGFLGRRYELIWDSQLWKDSLTTVSVSVSAGVQDVSLGVLIDRVVAVRWDTIGLSPVQHEAVYYIDPTLFDKSGTPAAYVIMPASPSGGSVIRLVQKPSKDAVLTVLGKRKVSIITPSGEIVQRSLTQSTDSPYIRGIDHGLLSFAEGDMLTRERQYGKSQIIYGEASSTLRIAYNLEMGQQASEVQVSPSHGGEWSRDDWELGTSLQKSDIGF